MTPDSNGVASYDDVHARLTALLGQADPKQLARQVPACPDRTVDGLLAHTVGVVVGVRTDRLAGAGSDPWTTAPATACREASLDELPAARDWSAETAVQRGRPLPAQPTPLAE